MAATSGTAKPRVVSWGELLWDVYPTEARLGGASANLAFHAAQLGCESLLVSRVGRDELGARALELLRDGGVDVSGVQQDDDVPTGEVRVELVDGEPRFAIGAPAAWDRIRLTSAVAARIRHADALCFGTLAQRTPLVRGELLSLLTELRDAELAGEAEAPRDAKASRDREMARSDRGPLRVVDLNLRAPFIDAGFVLDALEHAEVVKLNEAEVDALRHLDGAPADLRVAPLPWLTSRVRLVAVTRGSRGALLLTEDERLEHPGFPSTGADPVGAGDAFTAVLARELCRGTPLAVVLERACRYAAWVASRPGAQPRPDAALLAALD